MRIASLLYLFLLIFLSSATSLNLYATSPTEPRDVPSSSCCLPQGPVVFEVVNQTYVDSELVDSVLIQADQWLGQGCSINNVTSLSLVSAFSMNLTFDGVENVTIRGVTTTFSETETCITYLYVSDPNPQSLYAYGPTTPPYIKTPYYCLPRGPIIYVPISQIIDDSTTYDVVLLQADQWNGPGCAFEDMTDSSIVVALGANITNYPFATRFLGIVGTGSMVNLYDSPLNYSLDLYSSGPTVPVDLSDPPCCIPSGPVTLVMVKQWIDDSTLYDVVYAEADQWVGSGCADNYISGFSIGIAMSANLTPSLYPGNTYRSLGVVYKDAEICGSTLYDSNPDPLSLTNIPGEVLTCLSILACLWLFYRYYRDPRKSFSVQLILILSVSDFFYNVFNMLVYNIPADSSSGYFFILDSLSFIQEYSLFWSATVSIILMKAFSNNGTLRQINARMWILFLLPSIVLGAIPVIVNHVAISLTYNQYWSVSLLVIPVAITIGCYIRAIRVIRNHPSGIRPKYHALLLYPAVQLVLFIATGVPDILNKDPNLSFYTKRVSFSIIRIPKGLMGLANAGIYLLQNRKKTAVTVSQPIQDNSSSESPLLGENSS